MAKLNRTIDEKLGSGYYEDWLQKERDVAQQERRLAINKRRFRKADSSVLREYWRDADLLNKTMSEYREALEEITAGKPFDFEKTDSLNGCVGLAIGVVEINNDRLDSLHAAGIMFAFMEVPLQLIHNGSVNLEKRLKKLKILLKKAEKERLEAWAEGGINAAVTLVTFMLPHVSILARTGVYFGLMVLDEVLGPDTSTAANAGEKGSLTVSHFGDSVDEIKWMSDRMKKGAKFAGHGGTVVGFAFDVNEISVGHGNVNAVKKEIKRTERAFKGLTKTLHRHAPAITKYRRSVERWKNNMKPSFVIRKDLRNDLHGRLRAIGYYL